MAVRVPGPRSIRWRLGGAGEGPFLLGLNLRDEYTELDPRELTDGTNFTLDERGVAIKRNDCPASADFPAPPVSVLAFDYSRALGLAIIMGSDRKVYKAAIGAGSWTDTTFIWSTTAVHSAVDFHGKMVFTHPADGAYSYDGTAFVLLSAARNGTCIASWQNKVFIGAVPGAGSIRSRLHWSGIGDETTWATTDFVDFREKDDKPLVALYGGSGLLVFKEDSTYRVNDPTSGAYQTIDWTTGCVGARAVIGQDGLIFVWGIDGLYSSNGFGRFTNVGDKVRPRFFSANVNATTKPLISAVSYNGRVYFAFPRTSSTIPDALLELNPRVGWLMETYLGGAQVGPLTKYLAANGQTKALFASGSATIKELLTGTTRTGFSCSLATGFQQIFGGYVGRVQRVAIGVHLPGTAPPAVNLNYLDGGGSPVAAAVSLDAVRIAGAQQLESRPRTRGRAFQLAINDAAGPLNSLSVFDAQMDALLTGLR